MFDGQSYRKTEQLAKLTSPVNGKYCQVSKKNENNN